MKLIIRNRQCTKFNGLLMLFAVMLSLLVCIGGARAQSGADTPPGMVLIEGGKSTIGAPESDFNANADSKPQRVVTLASFYIDALEVTNRDYAKCVAAGYCQEPPEDKSETRDHYYSYEGYGRFPVVNVTWEDATNYCNYLGKRLPTEAEWEKAAMGILEFRRYPWGNDSPKPYHLNLSGVPGDTEMGNSYPKGASSFGVLDTAANVSEWVDDWYAKDAYSQINPANPVGPEEGTQKVIRGDSWKTPLMLVNLTNRYQLEPTGYRNDLGFRCAKNVREEVSYSLIPTEAAPTDQKQAVVNSGQESGMFVLDEPGIGKKLVCIYKRGVIVDILEGPKEIAFTKWFKIKGPTGCEGWSLASSLDFVEK